MAFTEFYVQSTGSNLNAGSTTADSASVTSANGDWGNAAANRFTAASGTPFSGVSVGEFASIYLDAATVTTLIGRVTAINGGGASIDISTTARSGTTTTGATGRTCKIGGAWAGPNAASIFPLSFITNAAVNTSSNPVRVNVKGTGDNTTTDYTLTGAGGNMANNGPITIEGYTSSVGDGGRFLIKGPTSGTAIQLFGTTASGIFIKNMILDSNGTSGGHVAMFSTGAGGTNNSTIYNCAFRNAWGAGCTIQGGLLVECEAYVCNTVNNTASGNFLVTSGCLVRCVSHDSTGNTARPGYMINSSGAVGCSLIGCIADTNGGSGFVLNTGGTAPVCLVNCDSYGNAVDGFRDTTSSGGSARGTVYIENCNFVNNTGNGVSVVNSNPNLTSGLIINCGFYGNGTPRAATNYVISGAIDYSYNPYADAANGDFRIINGESINMGRGNFLQLSGYSKTFTSYPSVGAYQSIANTVVQKVRRVR